MLYSLEKMEESGLGKLYFPLKYELVFSKNLNDVGMGKDHFLIGGWPIFLYNVMANGFENAIRNFRGSHDLDKIVKNLAVVSVLENIYKNHNLEILNTHLDKKSYYAIDPAIKKEEVENAIYFLANILSEKIKNKDENYLIELSKRFKEFYDKLKDTKLKNYFERNFYSNLALKIAKGSYLELEKLGRLELDIYYPQDGKNIKVGGFDFSIEEFDKTVKYNLGQVSFYLPSPLLLYKSKIKASRTKDYYDIVLLTDSLYNISEVRKRKIGLKSPEYYISLLDDEEKEKLKYGLRNLDKEFKSQYKRTINKILKAL